MDCRIQDCRIVHREGSIASVPPDFFGPASQNNRYFGTIKKMLYEDTMARVHWQGGGTTSIIDIDILQLETLMPKKFLIVLYLNIYRTLGNLKIYKNYMFLVIFT